MYIDIHTHHPLPDRPGTLAVRNILMREARHHAAEPGLWSVGLHPWESESESLDISILKNLLTRPGVVAVGECGLDRLRGAPMRSQTAIFERLALLAEEFHKPLFIHCVRAWQEIIGLKAALNPSVPWMIHGYRGKAAVARQLIDSGFYLSFGENLLSMNPVLSGILRDTPDSRLLLETDEGGQPIESIYRVAATIKNVSLESLQNQLITNFEQMTGIHGTPRVAATH